MADDRDDAVERFLELSEFTMAAHAYLRALLRDLPVPVTVAPFDPKGSDQSEALLGLNRARHLIKDEPISDIHKEAYNRLVLDWFSAYEIMALTKEAGPAPWRLDTVEHALHRFTTVAEMIEKGELEDDES